MTFQREKQPACLHRAAVGCNLFDGLVFAPLMIVKEGWSAKSSVRCESLLFRNTQIWLESLANFRLIYVNWMNIQNRHNSVYNFNYNRSSDQPAVVYP